MGIICFSASIRQCYIAYGVILVQLCHYHISYLLARVASNKKAFFNMLPVGLCEGQITTTHPLLTIMFKNVHLRLKSSKYFKIILNIKH